MFKSRFGRSSPVMSAADVDSAPADVDSAPMDKPNTDKSLATTASVVVLGEGSLDLRLLTAKLAARSGFQTSLFSARGGVQDIWVEQMYGSDGFGAKVQIEDSSEPLRAEMVDDMPSRTEALASAEALALISDSAIFPESALTSVLNASTQLKRVVLLSNMGVTRATDSPIPFVKNEKFEQLESEERLRAACASRGIGLSIVRVGTLKGGGAGRAENERDVGLSSEYYNNVMDIETLRVTKAFDSQTLGAKLTAGDPFDEPGRVAKQLRKGSFDPKDDETSRVSASAAVVAALRHEVPLEFSVSSAAAESVPTSGQWEALLNDL